MAHVVLGLTNEQKVVDGCYQGLVGEILLYPQDVHALKFGSNFNSQGHFYNVHLTIDFLGRTWHNLASFEIIGQDMLKSNKNKNKNKQIT